MKQFIDKGEEVNAANGCARCKAENQAEFTTEINIHFRGLKNIDHPGVLFVSRVRVCQTCGFSQFMVPKNELARLATGGLTGKTVNHSSNVDRPVRRSEKFYLDSATGACEQESPAA